MTRKWCTLNGVTGIIRSHEVRQGENSILLRRRNLLPTPFRWVRNRTRRVVYHGETPPCITRAGLIFAQVFSAPNYVDQAGNKGAYVSGLYIYLTAVAHSRFRFESIRQELNSTINSTLVLIPL